jgi:hypothetical protein
MLWKISDFKDETILFLDMIENKVPKSDHI